VTGVDREALRANANYLREVRPVDPEEIYEYIEGTPHPAVVREALREEAFDLALVERADGTFVPAPEGAVDPPGWAPTALPGRYARVVEDRLVERYGANWHRGASGDRLREAVRRLKADYFAGRSVGYDDRVALAYAVYHLPGYYAAVGYVLDRLATRGLLGRRLRVLDVGAGSGGPALGLHDYLFGPPGEAGADADAAADAETTVDVPRASDSSGGDEARPGEDAGAGADAAPESPFAGFGPTATGRGGGEDGGAGSGDDDRTAEGDAEPVPADDPAARRETGALVDYHAVEPSAAADVLERTLAATTRNFRTRIHRETAEAYDPAPDGPFDLVLFANVLSELADPVAVVERYADAGVLAADGAVVLLAPADRETSTNLRAVERAVAPPGGPLTVYAPDLRLWPDVAPSDRGWSFDRGADVEPPAFQRRLAEASREGTRGRSGDGDDDAGPDAYLNRPVQFSDAVLRRDGRRLADVRADPDRHMRMRDAEAHVTRRVDELAVKLSHDLSPGGDANPLFKIGDGSETVEQYAVLTRASGLNRALVEAPYGAVLAVENVLVLWNDDEGAYNHVVDAGTVVDRVA
jgi:hypothetical protein